MIYVTETTEFTLEQARQSNFIFVEIKREEVERQTIGTIGRVMGVLEQLGSEAQEKVLLLFDGYNEVPEELYHIPAVKDYTKLLLAVYPHLFFFLSNHEKNASILYLCTMDASDMITVQNDSTHISSTRFRHNPELLEKITLGLAWYLGVLGRPLMEAYIIVEKISGG